MEAIPAAERVAIEDRAAELGLPLIWPPSTARKTRAARVASLARELGVSAVFVLATSRLAFCGGYDIDDLDVLAEAADAADITAADMLRAAQDRRRDGRIDLAGRVLLAVGATHLPAVLAGRSCTAGHLPSARAARAHC